ncbi:ABC transporter permease [Streptomyces sp. NPDC007901]|uniref:ABC transporter permease n=1 Tax=Streptomyces sp. NPDC007901 TaxID=3364785 RepID=UPI0036E16357
MTTATPTAPAGRPRLTRVLLRLHRPALYAWTLLVLATATVLLLLHGPLVDGAAEGWRQFRDCEYGTHCGYDQSAILRYKDWYDYGTLALVAVPFLAAAWAGGALLGKELESGTAQLAWAQSSTPVRWLTVRLAAPAALVTVGTGLLVWLHHLAWAAGRGRIDSAKTWYDIWTFHTNGPTLVALALTGLAAGALAGLLLRRTLPALGLGLLLTAAIWGTVQLLLPRLWPAATRWWSYATGAPSGTWELAEGRSTDRTRYYVTYHTYADYWPLQLTTTALLLAIAALLTLACFLTLRRLTGKAAAR